MKKVLTIVSLLLIVFSLVSCKKRNETVDVGTYYYKHYYDLNAESNVLKEKSITSSDIETYGAFIWITNILPITNTKIFTLEKYTTTTSIDTSITGFEMKKGKRAKFTSAILAIYDQELISSLNNILENMKALLVKPMNGNGITFSTSIYEEDSKHYLKIVSVENGGGGYLEYGAEIEISYSNLNALNTILHFIIPNKYYKYSYLKQLISKSIDKNVFIVNRKYQIDKNTSEIIHTKTIKKYMSSKKETDYSLNTKIGDKSFEYGRIYYVNELGNLVQLY